MSHEETTMTGPEPKGNDVDAPTLARILRCDERSIHMLARKGLCVRAGRNQYELFESVGNVVEHLRREAAGHTSADGKIDAMKSNAALKNAQRRLIDLKYDQLRGQLISIPDIEMLWGDLIRSAKWLFLTLPSRARYEMPELTGAQLTRLEEICHQMLRELTMREQPPLPTKADDDVESAAIAATD
jgi:phage terminase Nu1 subunit (DNA packaging protein)